jgi:hypothetical protein
VSGCEPDGAEFDAASIDVCRIKEYAEYEGVRVRFNATLALVLCPSGAQRSRLEWKKSKHGLKLVPWVYNRCGQKEPNGDPGLNP